MFIYRCAEIAQMPLYFLLNNIAGRLRTALEPNKFGNYPSATLEILRRCVLACLTPFALIGTAAGSVAAVALNFFADRAMGNQPYICIPGAYTGDKSNTFATFNMSTLLPNMTLNDGFDNSYARLEGIAEKLHDFHFVCGQEVDGDSARFLAKILQNNFSEFYTYFGKSNTPFLQSGLFFACKEKALSVQAVPFTAKGVQTAIRRLLVIVELAEFYVAFTHLDGVLNDPIHLQEVIQIKEALVKLKKPYLLCGDLNEDRQDNTAAYQALTETFIDPLALRQEPVITCTDAYKLRRFDEKSVPTKLSIDYMLYPKIGPLALNFKDSVCHSALSDHSLLHGEYRLISSL